MPLRPPVAPGDAGGPAADRRADRGRGGEHLRRARREGVRAGGAAAGRASARQPRVRPGDVTTRSQARYAPLIGFLPYLGLAAILLIGGRAAIDGTSTSVFTAFYGYLLIISPMRTLGYMLGPPSARPPPARASSRCSTASRRSSRRRARRRCRPGAAGRAERRLARVRGRRRPALQESTSRSRPARPSRCVGGTGSGKTALVSLLPRLYDATAGSVLIDGADVREVDPMSLRHEIAVVTDDPFLFSATVHENIAYARPDATREEVEAAARRAQADGSSGAARRLRHVVGERGLTLSGGQRQRIAIARAVLADPRVLMLDDATSSVDASTEQEIKLALREVMADARRS